MVSATESLPDIARKAVTVLVQDEPIILHLTGDTYGSKDLGEDTREIVPLADLATDTTHRIGILVNEIGEDEVGVDIGEAIEGGSFDNSSQSDVVQVLSDEAADTGKPITIYSTLDGVNTVVREIVTTNGTDGTTPVDSSQELGKILGAEKGLTAGNITIQTKTGPNTIITMGPTDTSAGITEVVAELEGLPFGAVSDASSTEPVGAVGTDVTGATIYGSVALNGGTGVVAQYGFSTITKWLTGAVPDTDNVTFSVGRLSYGASADPMSADGYADYYRGRSIRPNSTLHWIKVDDSFAENAAGANDRLIINRFIEDVIE